MSDICQIKRQILQFLAKNGLQRLINFDNELAASTSQLKKEVKQEVKDEIKEEAVESTFNDLLNWNKVLAFVTPQADFSLIYNKRSLIYQKSKLYKECLNNIMLAERFNIKEDLTERKKFCQLAIQQQQSQTSYEVEKNLFQLTYTPNPRMPFVIDCLKLQNNEYFGNHIITDQYLNIGDVICVENNLFVVSPDNHLDTIIENDSCYQRCSHCYKSNNMDLIPCDNCCFAMFCSTTCKDEALQIYHKYECSVSPNLKASARSMRSFFMTLYLYHGDIKAMKKYFEARGSTVKTVFDYDLSCPGSPNYNQNLMDIFDSHKAIKNNEPMQDMHTLFNCHLDLVKIWKGNEDFIWNFVTRHNDNIRELGNVLSKWPGYKTQFIEQRQIVGTAYYPFLQLINHSCIPNIICHTNEQNQMVLIVCRPIQKGGQLFVGY